jgi:HEAT repeat protein
VSAALGAALSLLGPRASAFVWPNVPEQVARSLEAADPSERRLAAQRLVELPPAVAAPLVRRALADSDVEVRLAAAEAAIAQRVPQAGELVMGWLGEGDVRLRLAACGVVRAVPNDRAVAALGRVLGDPDPGVRLAAATAMGASGLPEAVAPLLGHLDDPAPEVRAEVARSLGRIGDARAVVPLVGKVQDGLPEVRQAVARALGELGDARAASSLMIALQDASDAVRIEAAAALGRLGSDEATPAIAALLEAPPAGVAWIAGSAPSAGGADPDVRAAALGALGRIGSDAAARVLVAALAKDDPERERTPVRDALVDAGAPAARALAAALSGSTSPTLVAGAALALGDLRAPDARVAITRAMERGVLAPRHGLRALGRTGAEQALPIVLERLEDEDPVVRREAVRAAAALLDPARPDGRAVDPASAALRAAGATLDERLDLVRLLGRTGTPRAHAVLLPLVSSRTRPLRLAALDALGALSAGAPAVDDALLTALDDESAEVRLRAAIALSRVGTARAAERLLDRLTVAAEQDRGALGVALAGALSQAGAGAVSRAAAALTTAPDAARDALIEGLGRRPGAPAGRALAALVRGSIDDRRKVAEALAGHPEEGPALRALASDPDPSVRANAAWSLGAAAGRDAVGALAALLADPDVAVAGNAAAALGRVAAREGDAALAAPSLCPALRDARSYVRANALAGLSLAAARCEGDPARALLASDPSDAVRLAAADALWRAGARPAAPPDPADRKALLRCASEDRDAAVASRCERPRPATSGTTGVAVLVVPDGGGQPLARAPFALVRADGLLRLGLADRRGEVFERDAPRGPVRLAVPAPLAR